MTGLVHPVLETLLWDRSNSSIHSISAVHAASKKTLAKSNASPVEAKDQNLLHTNTDTVAAVRMNLQATESMDLHTSDMLPPQKTKDGHQLGTREVNGAAERTAVPPAQPAANQSALLARGKSLQASSKIALQPPLDTQSVPAAKTPPHSAQSPSSAHSLGHGQGQGQGQGQKRETWKGLMADFDEEEKKWGAESNDMETSREIQERECEEMLLKLRGFVTSARTSADDSQLNQIDEGLVTRLSDSIDDESQRHTVEVSKLEQGKQRLKDGKNSAEAELKALAKKNFARLARVKEFVLAEVKEKLQRRISLGNIEIETVTHPSLDTLLWHRDTGELKVIYSQDLGGPAMAGGRSEERK